MSPDGTRIHANASVDTESMLILALHLTRAGNDRQQVTPMLAALQALPEGWSAPKTLLADAGYFSATNLEAGVAAGIEPLMAIGRDEHHSPWRERFKEPTAPPVSDSPVEHMKHALKTRNGRAACALRKQTVEPVFGIIKSVMNLRQFLLRGLAHVSHEWTLVCLAWNFKRLATLRPKSVQCA